MTALEARDLVRVPSLLSLLRIPLAAAFPFFIERPAAAIAILCAAGASDVLDGWYARRFHQTTATGAIVDPVTDKIFVLTVALTLVVTGKLSIPILLLLGTRDIGELPLVTWLALDKRMRDRVHETTSNVLGKAATALQFATVVAAIAGAPAPAVLAAAVSTAILGAAAAIGYWRTTRQQLRSA